MKLIESIKKEAFILIAFACLIIAVFVLYHPGANGPYMLDDFRNIRFNEALKIEDFSMSALSEAAFSMKSGPLYRPVSMLSFVLNYYLTGNTDGYPIKLINIFIHLFTAFGVFLLTLLLLRRMGKSEDRSVHHENDSNWTGFVALFIAALWLLHPLHVSTVLYTVQRMTELAAMFSFYAAIAYVKGRNDLLRGRQTGLWWILGAVGVGGAFAVLSKENGVLLPLLLLVIEGIFFRFKFHPDINKSLRYWIYGVLILPSLGLFLYIIGVALTTPAGGLSYRDFTMIQRLLSESRALFFYLRLVFLPDIKAMGLYHDDFEVSRGLLSPPDTLLSVIGIVILLAIGLYGLRKNKFPVLSFAILWYLAGHLLESSVVQLELVFEHRNYLPGYGLMFAAGYYIMYYLNISRRIPKGIKYAIPLLILILLAIPLKMRIGHWSLPSQFFLNEIQNHPKSPRSFEELGYQQTLVRQYPKAIASYEMAAGLDPGETGYLLAILEILVYRMNIMPQQELIDMIERSLSNNKITSGTTIKLFTIAIDSFRMDEDNPLANRAMVEKFLVTAITNKQPWFSEDHKGEAFIYLGEIRFRQNRFEDAAVALEKAISLIPNRYDARIALARIYMNLNKVKEAEEQVKWLEGVHLEQSRKILLAELRQGLLNLQRKNSQSTPRL